MIFRKRFSRNMNVIQQGDKINIQPKEKKPIEDKEIKLSTKKEPLELDRMDELFIESIKRPINEINKGDRIYIPSNKKEEIKPKKKDENEILYLDNIFIPSKKKRKYR